MRFINMRWLIIKVFLIPYLSLEITSSNIVLPNVYQVVIQPLFKVHDLFKCYL